MHWVTVGVGPAENNAGWELALGIRVQRVSQHRTSSWRPQFHAFSYRWALSSSGAVFPSVTRRASGPRWSGGPRRSCSSILPLGSLKDIGFDLTLRMRATVRFELPERGFLRWATLVSSFCPAFLEAGTGFEIELLGSCRRGPWWNRPNRTQLPPSQHLKPGSVVRRRNGMCRVGETVSCLAALKGADMHDWAFILCSHTTACGYLW